MNSRRPLSVTARKGREPLVRTPAGSAEATGRPADRSAAAISSGPIRRSGTPNATSRPAPTVTPAARARISSAGRTAPLISRATPTVPSVTQAARRQGRLSHGDRATVTAAAAASRAGPGNAALASHECPAAAVTACGYVSPARYKMPASAAPAAAAPAARPASRRNRRCRRAAATATTAATTRATCARPVSSRPAGSDPSQVTAAAPGPVSRPGATARATSIAARARPLPIRRMTSPG